ncbi:MAG: HIT family protein [Actinomycetota bacterium]|nr:HIT family protein [Actinomycetota bacterium]
MSAEGDCIFCRIVSGEAPSTKIYEDDAVISFMDIFPWAKGHCLVVSKDHHPTIFDIPEDTLLAVFAAARRLAPAVREGVQAEGLNLLQSNGEAAWQTVPHFHLHLIPRWAGDGLRPPGVSSPADSSELAEVASRIRERLG